MDRQREGLTVVLGSTLLPGAAHVGVISIRDYALRKL